MKAHTTESKINSETVIKNSFRLLSHDLSNEELKVILDSGEFNPDFDPTGHNALHFACCSIASLRRPRFTMLLEHGFNINVVHHDEIGNTPLHILTANEGTDEAIWLIGEATRLGIKVDFTVCDNQGKNLLILAAKTRNERLAIHILHHAVKQPEFDVNFVDKNKMSALHYACALGMPKLAEALLEYRANHALENNDKRHPIDCVIYSDDEIKNILKSVDITPTRDEFALSNQVIDSNNQEICTIIAGGKNMKYHEIPSLKSSRNQVVKALQGIVVDSEYDFYLRTHGNPSDDMALKMLAQHQLQQEGKDKILAQFDLMSGTSCLAAVKRDRMSVMQLLISKGADYAWLIRKVSADNNPILSELLRQPNIADFINKPGVPSGLTALHQAAIQGHVQVCQKLFESKANLDAQDKDKNTPIMAAAIEGRTEVVKLLAKLGADLDITNQKGLTVIRILLDTKQFELAQELEGIIASRSSMP